MDDFYFILLILLAIIIFTITMMSITWNGYSKVTDFCQSNGYDYARGMECVRIVNNIAETREFIYGELDDIYFKETKK